MKKSKPKKKSAKRAEKKLNPLQKILARIAHLVPIVQEAEGDLLKSWELFAHKILLAKRMKTSVMVITVNPTMLEYRELLQKEFPCSIQSPTEARFGLDSIEKF